jgi:alpha-galactosidase
VGLVDGVRIGSDVGVEWRGHLSAQSLLRDQAMRNFANQILWQADPDCILLRDRFHHLTDAQVRSLALYAGMSGGVMMTSDALDELSVERLRLWKFILDSDRATCHFPFLGQSPIKYELLPADLNSHRGGHAAIADPVLVQVRDAPPSEQGEERAAAAVFIFNTGDVPVQRTYALAALGIPAARYVYDWTNQASGVLETSQLSLTLAPHDGALLFLSPTPITVSPEHLS